MADAQLAPIPFTLVQNALDAVPKFNFFPAEQERAVAPVYVSHMPIKVPQGDCDPKMVAGIAPSVDYKLTVIDPAVLDGK